MKWLAGLFLVAALLFVPASPSQAQRGHSGGGHGFSRGGTHQVWHGGRRGGEFRGGRSGVYRHGGSWRGGWYGRGWHGGDWHWGGRVIIGAGPWWWGWPYAYGYPYASSYYYPYPPNYDYPPPAVQAPSEYVQQAPQGYWYYCASAKAYYPDVKTCPEDWIKVPPAPR